jgi:hypothetical protein
MAVKLMVEVMDHWQDAGLTAGERSDLLVIAENANDGSRETVGPMHEPYLLKRAGKTSAAAWRNAIGKLMKKGVLEYAVHDGREMSGFPGRWAVYRMRQLCSDGPHDGLHGQCTRPERVTSQVTQSEPVGTEEPELGHPTGDPIEETGHLSGANGSPDRCERVTSQVTPNPLSPLTPLSPPAAPKPAPAPPAEPTDEREKISPTSQADTIVAAYLTAAGRPVSSTTRSKLHSQAAQLLADSFPAAWIADRARELAARGWTDLAQHCDRSTVPVQAKATATKADWCGHCFDPNNRMVKDPARDNELVDCPNCHPAAVARRRRATEGAAA